MSDKDRNTPKSGRESAKILGRDRFSRITHSGSEGNGGNRDRLERARKRVLKRLLNRSKGRPTLRIVD